MNIIIQKFIKGVDNTAKLDYVQGTLTNILALGYKWSVRNY